MAYPVYEQSGAPTGIGSGVTLNVPIPGTVNSNDILLLQVFGKTGITWSVPSGWTAIYNSGARLTCWKRADGTETGTQAVTASSSFGEKYGVMHRVSGCTTSATPHEGFASANGTSATITIPDLASDTTGAERLCLCLTLVHDDNTANDNATNYSEASDQNTTIGSDAAFYLYEYQQAAVGKPGADSYTQTASDIFRSHVIAMIPAASAGYANNVNTVGTANIGKINGVATANIAKVNTV
jgi:hypothetical protein